MLLGHPECSRQPSELLPFVAAAAAAVAVGVEAVVVAAAFLAVCIAGSLHGPSSCSVVGRDCSMQVLSQLSKLA